MATESFVDGVDRRAQPRQPDQFFLQSQHRVSMRLHRQQTAASGVIQRLTPVVCITDHTACVVLPSIPSNGKKTIAGRQPRMDVRSNLPVGICLLAGSREADFLVDAANSLGARSERVTGRRPNRHPRKDRSRGVALSHIVLVVDSKSMICRCFSGVAIAAWICGATMATA